MQLPFLTIEQFAGKTLKPFAVRDARGGGHALSWDENASEGRYGLVFDKVRKILGERNETVTGLASLQYHDKKGFGNRIYRIDGSKRQYFLKILGDSQGNRRELFVWKALGYGANGRRTGKKWMPGLPSEVFAIEQLNSVLMPYYPGQLRELHGGAYELPMVAALLLYLSETLACMHREGLVFMDLCPENILYGEHSANSPIAFFLADMGSVKMVSGHVRDDLQWKQLCETVTAPRVTRAETRPPEDLFPEVDSCEEPVGYDCYTLARTALILLGLNSEQEVDIRSSGSDHFDLENPLQPLERELRDLLSLLSEPLSGKALDQEQLYRFFRNFFLERARFAAQTLDDPQFRESWRQLLANRINRYRMVLTKEDKEQLANQIDEQFQTPGQSGLKKELEQLNLLPRLLKESRWDEALSALETVSDGELLTMSRTARYSYQFHKKLLKTMARGHQGVAAFNPEEKHGPNLDQLPERETLQALRRGRSVSLGILHRQMIEARRQP